MEGNETLFGLKNRTVNGSFIVIDGKSFISNFVRGFLTDEKFDVVCRVVEKN